MQAIVQDRYGEAGNVQALLHADHHSSRVEHLRDAGLPA